MKSLFNITAEAQAIASALEEGELSPEMKTALSINQNELQEKAINYAYVIKTVESDISTIDEEIKRLQALKKAKSNAIDRMKEAVVNAMSIYGLEKVETPTLKLSIRRSESVEVLDNLDERYTTTKVTVTPDKIRIKNAIKAGEKVDGARIVENYSLQIK